MPKCKYCGQKITKFDKEICPYCGAKDPLKGDNCETMDITESIETVKPDDEVRSNFKSKSRIMNSILCILLGIFGIDELYLGFKNRFLIRLIINAVIYIGMVLLFYFTGKNNNPMFIFVLPLIIIFVLWVVIGVIFLFLHDKKDANGVFLK